MLLFFTFLQLGLDADEVSFYTEPLCWTSCRNGRIVNFFKHLLVLFLQRSQISCSVSCCLSLSRISFFFKFHFTFICVVYVTATVSWLCCLCCLFSVCDLRMLPYFLLFVFTYNNKIIPSVISRVRFLMRSLGFFIGLIVSAALWPGSRLSLYRK